MRRSAKSPIVSLFSSPFISLTCFSVLVPLRLTAGVLVSLLFLSTFVAQAQLNPNRKIPSRQMEKPVDPCEQGKRLVVTVLDDGKALLDRQAVVKLHNQQTDSETWQTTSDESQLTFCNMEHGSYDVEASAVGYLTGHKDLSLSDVAESLRLEILLRKDPSAFDIGASTDAIPANERKEANRAVYELKSGNLKEAEKRLDRIYKTSPTSTQVNFLYGYLYMQLNDMEKSETFLRQAAKLDPHRVQTFALLGRVQLQRQHYDDARKTLEQAVDIDSGFWMAHNLLADTYLRQKEYEKAREQAKTALDEGKGAASVAELILGQSLLETGNTQDGIQALKSFLQTNPDNPAKPQVLALLANAENHDSHNTDLQKNDQQKNDLQKNDSQKNASQKNDSQISNPQNHDSTLASNGATAPAVRDLALAAAPATLTTNSWEPRGVDDAKPWTAPGVACPTQHILDRSGQRMKELVDNITKFAAIESLVHERLDPAGNATSRETRKFDYVASINETKPGFLQTDEYRNWRYGASDLPDNISTVGFVTLALIFHPAMRDNYEMTCEGLGQWHGQPTWLVHFRQRDDKPNHFADYKINKQSYPMKLKGRAWISPNNFQIVCIESDLVNPLPLLAVQHQIAEYGPVHFTKKNVDLWLPETVDIYLDLNRHRYHRQHHFEHFMLFSVDTQDKSLTQNQPDNKPTKNP